MFVGDNMFLVDRMAHADRTYHVGEIELPPAFLVQHFGAHDGGDGLRSTGSWTFVNEIGNVFTLYEYMQTRTSLGRSSGAPLAAHFWSQWDPATFNIGGRENSDAATFKQRLKAEYGAFRESHLA